MVVEMIGKVTNTQKLSYLRGDTGGGTIGGKVTNTWIQKYTNTQIQSYLRGNTSGGAGDGTTSICWSSHACVQQSYLEVRL